MSTTEAPPTGDRRPADGGAPAQRAVIRWAWRLFYREWRQQFLIFALIAVAVAATIVGSAVAADTPPSADFGFGTAQYAATYPALNAQSRAAIARLEHRVGAVQLIENRTEPIPGSIATFQLRAQAAHGPFGGPMLGLVSGRYPAAAGQVAVTRGVASAFHLSVGSSWTVAGIGRQVVGIVENPQSLLDEFALVEPGQVSAPDQVTALFDATGTTLRSLGANVSSPASVAQNNPLNPETISLAALALGMLLIALVSVGGFTVLAQRRLRSIGMLQATGATDRHVRMVVRANGVVVGALGAVAGLVIGLVIWFVYRPSLERNVHHVIGVTALPWAVVAASMVLAVVAAYFAASRPARSIAHVPIVAALSGRPAPPRQVHRSAGPGIVLLSAGFVLLGYSGGTNNGTGGGGSPELVLGIVLLIPGLILLAPFFLSLTARLGRHAPIAARLALRDLARYRARSGSALAAISVGVLAAMIVMLAASARYGNVFDYAGPNLSANQLALHVNLPPGPTTVTRNAQGKITSTFTPPGPLAHPGRVASEAAAIAGGLGARLIALETPSGNIGGSQGGRQWNGSVYVATPQLLSAFGISSAQVNPDADILSSRPGLSSVSGLQLTWSGAGAKGGPFGPGGSSGPQGPNGGGGNTTPPCTLAGDCLAHPVVQELGALPWGVSAPNTVITEHAVRQFHLTTMTTDWLVQGTSAFTAAQVSTAELAASKTQLVVESKNDEPTSGAVVGWATIFGIVIALGVLGMSVGLVRSETARDLRTLAATGASGVTRRMLTGVTAGALGFLGALLGTFGGYVAMIGWLRDNSLNGGVSALANVPVVDLLYVLIGMPAFAAVVGWLLAGRQPVAMGRQPIE